MSHRAAAAGALLATGAWLAGPSAAWAGTGGIHAPASDLRSDFWREVTEPGYRGARVLFEQGLRLLAVALQAPSPGPRARRLHAAIARLELAHGRTPADPETLYYLALATAALPTVGGHDATAPEDAIAWFRKLREVDPDFYAERVAFELGILYTRIGRLEQAASEYRRSIERAFDDSETVSAHSNLAEVQMLAGRLEDAVVHYDRAIDLARRGGAAESESLALALWGCAVALHRLNEREAAIERARQALSAGGGTTDVLRADGVFFEPPYEIHYYEAMGHLARAAGLSGASADRARADATRSFERFLASGGSRSRFAEAARRELARLRGGARSPAPP